MKSVNLRGFWDGTHMELGQLVRPEIQGFKPSVSAVGSIGEEDSRRWLGMTGGQDVRTPLNLETAVVRPESVARS